MGEELPASWDEPDSVRLVVSEVEDPDQIETLEDVEKLEEDEDDGIDVVSFPVGDLARLDEMISSPRWVVPVLPGSQLEVLLDASIQLCKKGLDVQSEPCQRFFREGLTISFTKILTDDAVSSWKPEIHKCILRNSEKLLELIVIKLEQDWFPLLELLSILFNPSNKFHSYNANRPPESYSLETPVADDDLFARPTDNRLFKGWLVDLINRFGSLGGFKLLSERFTSTVPLSVSLVYALLKPFGLCTDFLTRHTIEKYFTPVFTAVPQVLENLTDDDLKKETTKSDIISSIIKCLKCLHSRISDSEELIRDLELFRLRMILRMLQVSSFNGKMNALNEINQVIQNVQTHYPHHYHHRTEEPEYLTGKRIAEWIQENQVLQIVLRDSLHQPQYVEKLEKILRFIIKEKTLTLKDLDDIWAAQVGKHDAIVKNLHDLLAKLAWDFSPEQLDHLFECFQASWTNANKRQREKLLELIRRLAEDDKDGVMAFKVLTLFWNLAHSNEVPTEIMDQALSAHVKVLDYSCSQRETQKLHWLNTSMGHLIQSDVDWVIPAMKHMREIFTLYQEAQTNPKTTTINHRVGIINRLQKDKQIILIVVSRLNTYMEKVRAFIKDKGTCDPFQVKLDGRYSHVDQIKERLNFLRFLIKEGQLYLAEEQANLLWQCLAEEPVFQIDREMGFEWFSKLMGEDPDLEPAFIQPFYERKILNFDATMITESGMDCFERFFKVVNVSAKKLYIKRDDMTMDDLDLTGTDYIWKIILSGSEDMASRAISFLQKISTCLGPTLLPQQRDVHDDFLSSCCDRLKTSYDTILILEKDKDSTNRVRQEVTRACRVLRVLLEYIIECDSEYGEERAFIPLYRAFRGRNTTIFVRFPSVGTRGFEDVEIFTHHNESLAGLRRQIIRKFKATYPMSTTFKMELYFAGEVVNLNDDRQTLASWGLRDKLLLHAKITHNNATNSPDSSEESSGDSPNHYTNCSDGPNIEAEETLPSVMMSMDEKRMEFLCQLCGLGSSIGEDRLRDAARNLLSMIPPCRHTESSIRTAFLQQTDKKPYNLLFTTEPATVLYRLEVLYSILFPAVHWDAPNTILLLTMFFVSGGAGAVVEMLTKNNFMPLADVATKRAAYLSVLKLTKAVLTATCQLLIHCEAEGNHIGEERLRILTEAVQAVPHPTQEYVLRTVTTSISKSLCQIAKDSAGHAEGLRSEGLRLLLSAAMESTLPDIDTIRLIIRLASATASGSFSYFSAEQHQANREPTEEDTTVCEEALEVLTLSFVLNPTALDSIVAENTWKHFLRTVLFHSLSGRIRYMAHDQFFTIATKATGNPKVLLFFVQFLFEIMQTSIREIPQHSRDVCHLLCNLLRFALNFQIGIPNHEQMLNTQLEWLRQAKELARTNGEGYVQDDLLEGHIIVARELVGYLSSEKKYQLGCGGPNGEPSLIQEILEEFVFPWSKAYYELKKSGEVNFEQPIPVCATPVSVNAILDLLVAMCSDCYPNLKLVVDSLSRLFNYSPDGEGTTSDWEFIPPIGSRSIGSFVGLKNAGATCYMNSVIQQLYMVDNIKRGVLSLVTTDPDADEGIEDSGDSISRCQSESNIQDCTTSSSPGADDRKNYNITILKQVQSIFGHLALSRTQYLIPNGLWKHFRLQGEAVNLREQQDAVEFFMSLIESVDEGMKALGQEQVMSKNLGGLFSDQKICKECPHRYSKEEPFSVISVDIRNHSSLLDSLEQYVKGELLEGADAYHCERCNKKVVTVKRLCVKKLPPVLAIQLKRFEYDYERLCPIKFNDYFEFPRDLDMEPYTVSGLAKIEGEIIDDDATILAQNVPTSYRLTGIVVHSGQASGGHYYSYISVKCTDGVWRWFKFDDGDVTECRMEDDDELKGQCFGGDYSGEVFDHMMKRMSFRRQKRWWNAYILFYTQNEVADIQGSLCTKLGAIALHEKRLQMSSGIEKMVLRQNIDFMHSRSQYSQEYFQFVRKLVGCNVFPVTTAYKEVKWTPVPESEQMEVDRTYVCEEEIPLTVEMENLALLSVQLASMFLFSVGFRTKKALRGNANDWFEVIGPYLKVSKKVRFWFATYALFRDPGRISEYLLECPSGEVRATFCKLLVNLAHYSKHDGIYTPSVPMATLSRSLDKNAHLYDYILEAVLNLLRRDVSEYGRHLVQYFTFFLNYAAFGDDEKRHLLRFNVPSPFISLALEDGILPPIKYQCADLSKLYQIVSILIRSCDVSHKCQNSKPDEATLTNPFSEVSVSYPLQKLPDNIATTVYSRGHIKKVLEEASGTEETLHLLQFLCWENGSFSAVVISEILGHIGYSYSTELKTFLDVLGNVLRIDDSWQLVRIEQALKGIPGDKEGLLDIIHRNKQSQPKRAYLFIKCVTFLMDPGSPALGIIAQLPELGQKWNTAIDWLERELDRRAPPSHTAYGYSATTWSPPSNEAANGSFFLERSHSAKLTLERAILLRVPTAETGNTEAEDEISSEGEREEASWETMLPEKEERRINAARKSWRRHGWDEAVPGGTQSTLNTPYTGYGGTKNSGQSGSGTGVRFEFGGTGGVKFDSQGPTTTTTGIEIDWEQPPPLESVTTIVGGNGGSGSGTFPLVMEQQQNSSSLKSSSSPEESHVNSPAPVTMLPPEELDSRPRNSGHGRKENFYSTFEQRDNS